MLRPADAQDAALIARWLSEPDNTRYLTSNLRDNRLTPALIQDGQTVVFSIVQAAVLPSTGGLRYLIVGVDAGNLREGMKNPNVSRVWRIAPAIAAHPAVASLLRGGVAAEAANVAVAADGLGSFLPLSRHRRRHRQGPDPANRCL